MSYQTSIITRTPMSTVPQQTPQRVSQTPVKPTAQSKGSSNKDTSSHPRSAYLQSIPSQVTAAPNTSGTGNTPVSQPTVTPGSAQGNATGKLGVTRGYNAHLPRNPNRPPPYTYQRQHEFPPFPPLTQHPVLPFLTTAFPNQSETNSAVPPSARTRPTIAPRASTTQRHVQTNVSTIPTMDVSRNDPTATFIRPPLVVPMLHSVDSKTNGIDGEPAPGTPLTYAIMHAHRTWFLDAEDFHKDNPNRIDYPPDLEPPRGWAPLAECTGPGAAHRCKQAKETKERSNASRTKGSYANADKAANDTAVEYGPSDDCHEKTVLRCTFCRREYHGPNAKSMWRRHVYDKHKVAMKNRREGSAGMAPRIPMPKKAKKATESSQGSSGSPALETPVLTLDLTNEQNLIRLLERVVSGNLDISLPGSLLESTSSGKGLPMINLQSIALALQKSGITVTLERGSPDVELPCSSDMTNVADSASSTKLNEKSFKGNDKDGEEGAPQTISSILEDSPPHHQTADHGSSQVNDDTGSGQKRKAAENDRKDEGSGLPNWNRAPLKDQTAVDRSNHNAYIRPGTPRKDKGKQKAMPRTPRGPRMSGATSPPEPRNPFTPQRHPSATALRAQALATTGEESYLTLVLSSPATMSPLRSVGRVSFTSPSRRNASPLRFKSREGPPVSDDALGVLGASSPRYPFDFNIEGSESSPSYLTAFDPIPLEVGTSKPSHWTPPALGPPAPLPESAPRSISRASSLVSAMDMDDETGTDEEHELQYPVSSPSERLRRRHPGLESKLSDEDFDMEAFLDLEDAGPEQDPNLPQSPHKYIDARGFAKEFGLLSQEEVDRIITSVRPSFEEEARSSKRRRLDVSA